MAKYYAELDQDSVVVAIHLQNDAEGYTEITKQQAREIAAKRCLSCSKLIDGQVVDNDVVLAQMQAEKDRALLEQQLENLELKTARGFLWLVKTLVQKGVLDVSDLPQQLIDYRDQVDALQAQIDALGGS